ncbi:hypothetical protein WG66_008472 [Moniliophthora roreri]|nr:hypothetical protein WG66_008472 [Moniliophthora roreri]
MRAFVRSTAPIDGVNDADLGGDSHPASVEGFSALGRKAFTFGIDAQGQDKFKAAARSQGYQLEAIKLETRQLDDVQPIRDLINKILHQRAWGGVFSTGWRVAAKESDIKNITVLLMLKVNELELSNLNDHYFAGKDAEGHPSRTVYLKGLGK